MSAAGKTINNEREANYMKYMLAIILILVTISCGTSDVEVNNLTETPVVPESSQTEMTEMPEESVATDVTPDDSNAEISETVE